jgi:pimeloyl-ACP methyl ester carboxylesterase
MAMDAVDVLTALGYQQVNLYGASYGTRIAQLVMRDHPEFVRSAILDSVVPIEVRLFDQNAGGSGQALESLFESCRNDPSCSSAYPDLEGGLQQYGRTTQHAASHP